LNTICKSISFATVALALTALPACSGDVCGPGTQRRQLANGDSACVAVAVGKGDTICDADAGVTLLEGNRCVSVVQCGEGTALDPVSGQCLPTQAGGAHAPPPCPAPAAGKICVNGTLRNFVDGSFLSGETVRVAVYDPSTFVGATPPALAETTATDTYRLDNVAAPGSGYLLIVTGDLTGGAATYESTGIGGIAQSGKSVRVDGYVLTRAQVATWGSTGGGVDLDAAGALLYRFFNDPSPPQDERTPTETHPVSGVQLIDGSNNLPAVGTLYFSTSLATLDKTLTSSSVVGGAIIGGGAGGLRVFTARGGGVTTWEAHQAFAIPHVVQIDFLHPM